MGLRECAACAKSAGRRGGGQRQKVKGINVADGVDGTTGNKLLQKKGGAQTRRRHIRSNKGRLPG